ncbi:hypothetical protein DFH07DRAFT_937225 [Mycena maculata]|uniref:Uncharacterized protein n=1 Tax=Mycena maculata TaxID=230809 RepID=A0AAD7NTF6_9AGAR|nr:hypothetical protein DFH07DRAFT_937225 [Mycena maculata]
MASAPALPSTSTFSFKVPLTPQPQPSGSGSTSTSPSPQKQRRVSLALPSSPRLVPAWNFRDDTSVPYAPKGKIRRIDVTADDEDEEEHDEEEKDKDKDKAHEDGDAATPAPEKKVRRKWTPEETQMLVDGCNIHGVGNWKAILSDPTLSFANRSPVDLKDRFRTYFPEAYRTHYPNARTHLPPSLGRAASPLAAHPSASASSILAPPTSASASAPTAKPNRSTHPDGTPLFPLPSPAHPKRRPFTPEEDAALLAGFRRHGAAWAAIAKDAPVFGQTGRRSMDLRDRFRNAWPGEYERAGYKARPKAVKKAKEKEKMKEEDGGEEVRGRARVGRAKTDEGLGRVGVGGSGSAGEVPGASAEGGPVRRRRRAHTSQGFKTVSMPPSVVGSDDEGEAGGGGAASDFGLSFGRSDFGFKFIAGKGEETALVGGMRHLEMAPDEAMPDAPVAATSDAPLPPPPPPPPPPAPSKFQSHFLQHRRQEELGLHMNPSAGGTIGRSAWGTQAYFSANPRLDPSSSVSFSPTSNDHALPSAHPNSPPLSSSASFPAPLDTGGFFELDHGVMERYDLEPAALSLTHSHSHLHHHHPAPHTQGGYPPHAFSSPALSFHSTSLSFGTPHSLSEAGTHDNDDAFDEDSSAFSIAESEPWGAPGGGGGGAGGGFRGFTHHSNTAGDLIFGARTHQPIWSGVDAWGARGRGRGLAGIAEQGGKRGEDGHDAEPAGDASDDKALSLFSLDDLVDLSHDPPDAEMDGMGGGSSEMQMEPPGTPLLRASPAPVRTLHIHHHHHHHHHHYAATARSVSVPPGEAPEDAPGMGLGLGLMSAPATPALGAASVSALAPPSAFALDPALLLASPHPQQSVAALNANGNTLHSTLMGGMHSNEAMAMYNLPFLDLHYFGNGAGDTGMQQMQLEGWRGGEALDLARSASSSSSTGPFPPSSFSFAPPAPPLPPPPAPAPGMWKALGIPAPLQQHIPTRRIPSRPLMRSASGGAPTLGTASAGGSGSGSGNGDGRGGSHQRGQSAVVRPQDLLLNPEVTGGGGGPKGKRKRASWDGGGW